MDSRAGGRISARSGATISGGKREARGSIMTQSKKNEERRPRESKKTFEEYCLELRNDPRCDYDEGDDGEVITFAGGFRPQFVNRAAEHMRKK